MRIGELAERTGVSRRSLRYYEQHGLVHAHRTPAGWREYDERAVRRVANVAALLGKGLTLEGVKRLEPCLELDELDDCDDPGLAIETYEERRAVLAARLTELHRQHDRLTETLTDLRTGRR